VLQEGPRGLGGKKGGLGLGPEPGGGVKEKEKRGIRQKIHFERGNLDFFPEGGNRRG